MPHVAPWVVALLSRTWRVTLVDEPDGVARPSGGMIAIWHGRMLLAMTHYRDRGFDVLVSPSDDGTLIAATLRRFGYGIVRGSSSRGGARALREMLGGLRNGSIVVITPDGPRGPSHTVNPGCAWMSSATALPIFPLGLAADRCWRLKSWDRFTIPRPFARVTAVYGPTIRVARGCGADELARQTDFLRDAMIAAERRALVHVGALAELSDFPRVTELPREGAQAVPPEA